MESEKLFYEMNIGAKVGSEILKEVEFLKTNGIAEKVYTQKFPEKPYTWMAYVVAVSCKSIGGIPVGLSAREEYDESETITLPQAIRKLPISELNTLLVEIHRRLWDTKMKGQENLCKYCARKMTVDIDLNRLDFAEESLEKLDFDYHTEGIVVNLEDGFNYVPFKTNKGEKVYEEYEGMLFNQLVYRIPTVDDAIRHEKDSQDSIMFWRKIAADCLIGINNVNAKGIVEETLPIDVAKYWGLKLYNSMLSGTDLKAVRHGLREEVPTIQFFYKKECACEMKREVPVTMEATNFFSE